MSDSLRLNITSDPANLADVRKAVESLCVQGGFEESAAGEVGLCVNEAMANITRHAYGGAKDRPIEVRADCSDNKVRITLRDWGNGVDPTTLPPAKHMRDPLLPGGLGLVCMREMLDEMSFQPQPDGMLLEMVRNKNKDAQGSSRCTTGED